MKDHGDNVLLYDSTYDMYIDAHFMYIYIYIYTHIHIHIYIAICSQISCSPIAFSGWPCLGRARSWARGRPDQAHGRGRQLPARHLADEGGSAWEPGNPGKPQQKSMGNPWEIHGNLWEIMENPWKIMEDIDFFWFVSMKSVDFWMNYDISLTWLKA